MRRGNTAMLAIGVSVLCVVFAVPTGAQATNDRPADRPPHFFLSPALSNLSGFTSDQICPAADPKLTFGPGETAVFNVFWDDTVEADLENDYLVSWAIVKPGGGLFPLWIDQPTSFPFLPPTEPGDPESFCTHLLVTIPGDVVLGTYEWGARVIKEDDGTLIQGVVNSFTVARP